MVNDKHGKIFLKTNRQKQQTHRNYNRENTRKAEENHLNHTNAKEVNRDNNYQRNTQK